ncbi:MAG: ADP-glyceromanno-heptose 6-epimerase [Lentisphaerae bacterium]|nr:ADP-glyceromanno-heptose 6-epimerase [Lentisphaerota bacterium]
MNERVIVTGGAGFIGSNVIAALNERGIVDILVVDDLGTDEKWRNLVGLDYEDYIDRDDFRFAIRNDAVRHADAVIHLGACSATTEKNAAYLADNNYRYSRELCEWCIEHDVRFVYASSAATYGDGSLGYSDDPALLPQLRPLNMYGYSKHMFDLWAQRKGYFDRIAGLKYFNVYGPNEAHKGDMRSVVHKAWGQIRAEGALKLFKSHRPEFRDGEQVRDFVHVRDAVAATLFFMDQREVSGLFNCGAGVARTWNDLGAAVFAAMGLPSRIEYVDMPEVLRGKYQYRTEADVARLREAGFTDAFFTLEEGIADYVGRLNRGESP